MSEIVATIPREAQELITLLANVDKENPNPNDMDKLRAYLNANPAIADELGNLATMAQNGLANRSFAERSIRMSILVRLEQMRDGMGYQDAGELEKSLIAHLVLCWLRLHDCELRYHAAIAESMTLTKADWWERKLAHNQRRYLRACETLARVRKLNVKIQVNMAQRQIVTG